MPIDPSIPLQAEGPRIQPFNPLATLGDLQQMQVVRQRMQMNDQIMQDRQRELQDEAQIKALAQQYPDPDDFIHALSSVDPMKAQVFAEQVQKARKEGAQAKLEEVKQSTAYLEAGTQLAQGATPETWGPRRSMIVKIAPQLDQVLPQEYDEQAINGVLQIGQSTKDFLEGQRKGIESFLKGEPQKGLAEMFRTATNPQQWAMVQDLATKAGQKGLLPFFREFSPESIQKANQIAVGAAKEAEIASRAVDDARMAAQAAETARHNRAMERHGMAIESRLATAAKGATPSGTLTGAGMTPEQTRDYQIALGRVTATMPAIRKKGVLDTANLIAATGSREQLGSFLRQLAIENEDVDTQRQVEGRQNAVAALKDIRGMLQELKAAGVDTNILRGTAEDVARKLGTSTDTRLASVATRLKDALVEYRRSMTGVQFSVPEAQDYATMFPNYRNTLPLNEAILSGLERGMATRDKLFWTRKLGEGGAQLVGALPPPAPAGGKATPGPAIGERRKFGNQIGVWDGKGWKPEGR